MVAEEAEAVEGVAEGESDSVESGSEGEDWDEEGALQRSELSVVLSVGDLLHHNSQFLHWRQTVKFTVNK